MPPHEGERDQHSEDDDKVDNIGEDFEDDSLNRGESETEPTVEESLREYYEELDEHERPGDKDGGEDTAHKDEAENEEELSTEDKTDKHDEEAEEFSRDDAGEENLIEQCLDEYGKTIDHSATDSNDGDEEKDANPQEMGTDESDHKTDEDPLAHELEATSEVNPDANEDAEYVSRESREEEEHRDDVGRYIAEYDQALATTAMEPSERGEIVEIEQADTLAYENTSEYGPITLREDPQAFVRKDRETLVEEGRLPEKDELQLDDNTTLRFDVSEGLTLIHDEQRYEISTVEHQSIGDLDFYRYKTEQGEEFLHIPEQDKVVPPTETPWYAFPPNTEIFLDREYKHELLQYALDRAGGEASLRRDLEDMGTHIASGYLYRHLHDQLEAMSADKVITIFEYLGRDLDKLTNHISIIGHCGAIENPNLPFNLTEKDGTRLLAARYGDGTLCASRGRGPRFDYANKDTEQRSRVTESLEKIFGGANILNREYDSGEVPKVRTSTDIIGYTLQRAGAITGEVVDKNPHIPTWIREGSMENKREWLVQSFGDEGYVWPQRGKVCTGRSVEASSILSEEMTHRLDQMNWHDKIINGRWVDAVTPCKGLPTDIHIAIREHPPNLLVDERGMLKDLGIETAMYPSEIHRGKYGDFSVHWVLQTETREDSRRFLDRIGFPQERKQEELISALRLEG